AEETERILMVSASNSTRTDVEKYHESLSWVKSMLKVIGNSRSEYEYFIEQMAKTHSHLMERAVARDSKFKPHSEATYISSSLSNDKKQKSKRLRSCV
ncbi:MAG: hypothetical protein ACREOZ_05290, partial [Gloeomargaritales cyanobacterium]